MKALNNALILFLLSLISTVLYSQVPDQMSYQAVMRDANDDLLTNQSVGIRISILQNSSSGSPVYVETHIVSTNDNGLLSIEIGNGTVVSGNFANIDWSTGTYFLKTESDPNGGTSYSITGTSQLLTVPYAFYAKSAGNNVAGPTGPTGPQGLVGPSGPKGSTGSTGVMGLVGATGPTGPAGAQGLQGLQGIAGTTGAAGPTGPAGTTGSRGPTGPSGGSSGWALTGNGGTVDTVNFIGTTDNKAFNIKVNNQLSGRIEPLALSRAGTFIGYQAGIVNNAFYNVAFGYQAFKSNTTGLGNTAMGARALQANVLGYQNTAIGHDAMFSNTNADANTAIGYGSLYFSTLGDSNTAVGFQSMYYNISGLANTAIGERSLYKNNNGGRNVAIGANAVYSNTSGHHNVGVGFSSLQTASATIGNVGIGSFSLTSTFNGHYNSALGYESLKSNYSGQYNTGIGVWALRDNTIGSYNVALGYMSADDNTNGQYNTAVGYMTMTQNTTGSYNTAIGCQTFLGGTAYSNSTALGYQATPTGSNQVRLGNASVTSIGGYKSWSTLSDARFKKNVSTEVPGLSFIMKLRPVTYSVDKQAINQFLNIENSEESDALADADEGLQSGFIAQEVESAAASEDYAFSGVDKPSGSQDYYSLRYAEFTVPLVKAIQEQQIIIEELQKQIDDLKARLQEE